MEPIQTILTHPGSAHKDEFLACATLLSQSPVPIERRDPAEQDLADPLTAVLDVGHRHEPDRHNFDHHQFPADHPPTCSLSLVLGHLNRYEDAKLFCDWLEPAEWFDCRGPGGTAEWLGVDRNLLARLQSPIDVTLLRRFARHTRLVPGDPLWEIMRMIGEDLIEFIDTLHDRLAFIDQHAEFWDLDNTAEKILFLPRTEPLPDEPSMGLERYVAAHRYADQVAGFVYPDRRGTGYGLSRYRDHTRLDFTQIADHEAVHFAHARGFVAKTSATDPGILKKLITQAVTKH